MENRKTEAAELLEIRLKYLFEYRVDLESRIITLADEIDSEMFAFIDAALSELERQNNKAITVRINSEGGYVYDALAIVGRLQRSKCRIITEGYGAVMSAATLILSSGWKRRISRFAWYMWHESSYEISGRHSEVKDFYQQEEREENQWCTWMAEFTKRPKHFWKKHGMHKDSYFSPQELLEMGAVDEIF